MNCEKFALRHLFLIGHIEYKVEQKIALSQIKYFNQRSLNHKQKFASDIDFIFFTHSITQQIQIDIQTNVVTSKVVATNFLTIIQTKYFKETLPQFIASSEGFSFANMITGAPAYWKMFLNGFIAMAKQLALPTVFSLFYVQI